MGGSLEQNTNYFNSEIARWMKTIAATKGK